MLTPDLRAALVEHLRLLRNDVVLYADAASAREDLIAAVLEASPRVSLGPVGPDFAPDGRAFTFAVGSGSDTPRIFFAGLPNGHEFASLVLALLHVGGHPPKVDSKVLSSVSRIESSLRFETFYSPTCLNCPDVVQALNTLAALNPNITHVAINTAIHSKEASDRGVLSVPTVFCNGERFASGRMSLPDIVDRVLAEFGDSRPVSAPQDLGAFDLAVVGGGPAGVASAIYSARKGVRTILLAERLGGQVLDTVGIENVVGIPKTEGPRFARDLESHVRSLPVEIVQGDVVESLLTAKGGGYDLSLRSGSHLTARSVVLAPGASWRKLNIPGEQEYLTRGVTFCPHCDGPMFAGKKVAVIGGGNSGVEAALDLANIAAHVSVLEYAESLRADAVLQSALHLRPNVSVHLASEVLEIAGDSEKVTHLYYKDRVSGSTATLDIDGIFVQIGLVPATAWLPKSLEKNAHGEVVIDAKGRTNLPGVFAAGDATTAPYKQIVTATAAGATAAIAAFEYLMGVPTPHLEEFTAR